VSSETGRVNRCPKCFGRDVRPSRKGGFLDSVMEKFGRTPYRCRSCHKRFYVYVPRERDEVDESAESPENEASASGGEEAHDPDLAKPAEP
jgi:DNA-directed RNA polymerase subunit RPC12/RpoP